MHETMDLEHWKQRREEMLRDGELAGPERCGQLGDGRAREGNDDDQPLRA